MASFLATLRNQGLFGTLTCFNKAELMILCIIKCANINSRHRRADIRIYKCSLHYINFNCIKVTANHELSIG